MGKKELLPLIKLYSTIMGVAFAAVAAGLIYSNSQKEPENNVDNIIYPPETIWQRSEENGTSPQP